MYVRFATAAGSDIADTQAHLKLGPGWRSTNATPSGTRTISVRWRSSGTTSTRHDLGRARSAANAALAIRLLHTGETVQHQIAIVEYVAAGR